ncbi:MAG: tetratricopeptide repeat protein [Bacteroidales bacterium]|nr:tetratricopeptide repeat protein [Bacteroidales bacterium]
MEDYRTILNLDSNDIFSCVGISYAYWMLHEMELCFKYLDRAYIIDPKNILTLNNLSYFHGQAGNYDTGLKYANEGLALDSLTNDLKATLLNNRGYAYIGLKNYDKALEDINNSILLFPENSFAFYNRALANIGLNKTDNVCSDLKKSKKLGGNFIPKELNEKYCKN